MTGLAALRRHGMRVPETKTVTLLVPAGHTARRSRDFIHLWPTKRMPGTFCYEGAVQFALPARAVADAAQELGNFRQVRAIVASAVQQRLCTIESLQEEVVNGPVRGSAALRKSLSEVVSGIRSAAEGDFADLLRRARLPMPMFNARLYTGQTFIAIADAWWPDAGVAAEVDSREWHISPEDWQYTLERHARMSALGILVLHFTPAQIRAEPERIAAHIRSALAVGHSRPALPIRTRPATS
jgi:very-short-patch-repair endonuclease